MQIKRFFKDVILFEMLIKNYQFAENLETTHTVAFGGSCYLRHYDALRTKVDM